MKGRDAMSNIAIGADKKTYYADSIIAYSGEFFCPGCGCKMILKNHGADEKEKKIIRPYFSATSFTPHDEDCAYKNICVSYSKLKESGFHTENFFASLLKSRNNISAKCSNNSDESHGGAHTISTVNQLWQYCRQHADSHVLPDGTKVSEIYQAKRNLDVPDWNRNKNRLVLLGFRNCNFKDVDDYRDCLKVWCYLPHDENTVPPAVYYTLGFKVENNGNTSLMRYFCEKLYAIKNTHGHTYLVVGGEWNNRHCQITCKKQIHIIGN